MKLYIWRHPKPSAVRGLCFGQLDVAVDRRKVKRLANQIDRYVKKHKLPKVIWVSHLQRSKQVGEVLAARGYQCLVDPQLAESYFGAWEGKPWTQISKAEVDAWCNNFAHFAPEGGESLTQLFARVAAWINKQQTNQTLQTATHNSHTPSHHTPSHHDIHSNKTLSLASVSEEEARTILVVGHAGWITTATLIAKQIPVPEKAIDWPMPAKYQELRVLSYPNLVDDYK
ncbi:phosphoglycerate mutase [Psychrobacter sp. FDAARGOS_221]|nr:phosphoglycerate mutase [Psychrobacter sp. FDAARGOS_221]